MEDVLDRGLLLIGTSPVHIVIRGTTQSASVRCDWRGVARTAAQREEAIRFWLGKDDDWALPTPAEVEAEFMTFVRGASPRYQDFMAATWVALARGGLSTDLLTLACYADYRVGEYLLGNGPVTVAVAYDQMGQTRSYDLYRRSHAAGEFGPATSTPLLSEAEYEEAASQTVEDTEKLVSGIVGGRESIVFLAPMAAHNAIAVEGWQVVAQWDLQTDDEGTVNAVRYGVSERDPEYTQTLADLQSRITAATSPTSTSTTTPLRIPNVSGLRQYYVDIGAYGDITPGDNATTTFTPAQPPPVYAPAVMSLTATASGEEGADLSWTSVGGASGYHLQHRISGADERWATATSTATGTSYTVTGLPCGETHEFRVGAYGDGTTYNSRAGLWSPTATTTARAC